MIHAGVVDQIIKWAGKDKSEGKQLAKENEAYIRKCIEKQPKEDWRPRKEYLPKEREEVGDRWTFGNDWPTSSNYALDLLMSKMPARLWTSNIRHRAEAALAKYEIKPPADPHTWANMIQRALKRNGRHVIERDGNDRRWS